MFQTLPAENSSALIASTLAESGWSVTENFLPTVEIAALAAQLQQRWDEDAFRAAGVGVGEGLRVRPEVRSDQILWLDDTLQSSAETPLFAALEVLRLAINQQLFLGLFSFEGHMTLYPPGSFYRKHLDQFQGTAYRKVSAILYLNDNWQTADGGALRLYIDDGYRDILPHGGTLVTFLSERFYHEVLPTQRARMSVTGWLKIRV